jgi:ABC-2 type transport system permease protein
MTAFLPEGGAGTICGGRLFARTCAAEWARLWTVAATWWFLVAAAVVSTGIGLAAGSEAAADPAEDLTAWDVAAVAVLPAHFALLALGLTSVTSDHATGGIVPTLQWTPRRAVLLAARTLVVGATITGLGVLLALAAALAAAAIGRPVLGVPAAEGGALLATVAFVVAAGAGLAMGLGLLLRSTPGALVGVVLLDFVLPLFLGNAGFAWARALAELLPGSSAVFLLTGEPATLTAASAVAVLLGWAGGALLLGGLRLVRDDANR